MENTKTKSGLKQKDFWLGIFIILASVALLLKTGFQYQDHYMLPRFIFFGALVTGMVMLVQSFTKKSQANLKDLSFNFYEILVPILVFVTLAVVNLLGFYLTSAIFTIVLFAFLIKDFSVKGIIRSVVYSIFLNIAVYIIFTVLFRIMMPRGLFI